MFEKSLFRSLAAVATLVTLAATARAVHIETVSVGNPVNSPDTRYKTPGYGGVDYVYSIGKYEVTAGQYADFLNAVAAEDTYGLYSVWMWSSGFACKIQRSGSQSGEYTYSVADDWADRPVNYVSWGDAARFANWLHNGQPSGAQGPGTTEDGAYFLNGAVTNEALQAVSREDDWKWAIPTGDEWYKAAYHQNDGVTGNYYDYPAGSDSVPSNDLIDPDPGNNATFLDGDHTIGSPYYRTELGAHENSGSPYGTFDQGGNVWEWSEMIPYGLYRSLWGGSFNNDAGVLRASYNFYNDYPMSEYSASVGFRVASVPEPGSFALLVCGAVAGLMWWKRRR